MLTKLLGRVIYDESLFLRLAGIGFWNGAITFVLVLYFVWSVVSGKDIYYLYPGGAGIAKPNQLPDAWVQDYVERVLRERHTWDYETLKSTQAQFREQLHPRLRKPFDLLGEEERKLAKQKQMMSSLAPATTTILKRDGWQRTVVVDAVRRLYVGSTRIEDDVRISLVIIPRHPRHLDEGFWIFDMEDTPIKAQLK